MKKIISFILLIVLMTCQIPFVKAVSAETTFKDVQSNFWAYKEINFLKDFNIINGYPDGTFQPNNTITRAQAAIMLKRAFNLDTSSVKDPLFKDVNKDYHAYKEIAAVVEAGFMEKGEYFRPNDYLTRGEMAKILVKAFNLKGTYNKEIKDVSNELLPYVSALAANGITQIYEDNTFRPNNTVKRAHFAVFFSRVMNPNFRAEYSVLNLFLPQLQFGMSVSEVKKLMQGYILENEFKVPLNYANYELIYSAKVSGLVDKEQFILLFKDDQLVRVAINVDNLNLQDEPVKEELDAVFDSYLSFYKPYVGTPVEVEQLPTDEILLYSKKGTYQGNFYEDCKLIVEGYDLRKYNEGYMTTYMFIISKK
jgi:S-layer homology domain